MVALLPPSGTEKSFLGVLGPASRNSRKRTEPENYFMCTIFSKSDTTFIDFES